jgi:RNA polymerase sigma factor (sigma-70 family)
MEFSSASTMDGEHLAALMRRIATADREAFAALFQHLAPRVKAYLMRLGADAGMAEDLAQDVMLTVWREASRFDAGRASVVTWVFTIARNRRIDRLRRESRPDFDPEDPLFVADPVESAETAIEIAQREHSLRRAIEDLPREQAELIHMAYYEDLAHGGIAARRDLPLGTVKSRLRLALARLRRVMGEDEPA